MDYRFIRHLIEDAPTEALQQILRSLGQAGIEGYMRKGKELEFVYITTDEICGKDCCERMPEGSLYVSAADLEAARAVVRELSLERYFAGKSVPEGIQTEMEKAEAAYYKKRKWLYIECLVIVGAVVLYLLYQWLFH